MPEESTRNSRRRLDKVTFTPLVLPESQEGGGALELAATGACRRSRPTRIDPGRGGSGSAKSRYQPAHNRGVTNFRRARRGDHPRTPDWRLPESLPVCRMKR
jgi:hypothetical protein